MAGQEITGSCTRCTLSVQALKACREKNVELTSQLAAAKLQTQSLGRMLAGATSGIPAPDLLQNVNRLRKQLQAASVAGGKGREAFSRDGSRPATQGSTVTEISTGSNQKPVRLPVSPYTIPVRTRPATPPPPQPPVYDDGLLHLLTGPHPPEHHTLPSLTGVAPSQSTSTMILQDSLSLNDTTVQPTRAPITVTPSLLDSEFADEGSSLLLQSAGNYHDDGSRMLEEFQGSSRASYDW
jgi:hypothetical protein